MSKALAALKLVIDPELRAPITELGMVEITSETNTTAQVIVKLTIAGCPAAQKIERDVREVLSESFSSFELTMSVMTQAERDELKVKLRGDAPVRFNPFAQDDNFTKVIFVGSGKGGVGKSTLTTNISVALASLGHKVGLIDADIFGYSIPGQLGISENPTRLDDLILPPIAFGVKVMSIGFFVTDNQPVGWRGPMLHRAIEQFLTNVYWGDLDYLLVDLPPGTGDVAISLGQLLKKARSLVITTPQSAAATVAERSGAIGLQTGQDILGVIENLSYLPSDSGNQYIFGQGGGKAVADRLSALSGQTVELLAQLPISSELRESSDNGVPLVSSSPEHEISKQIFELAKQIAAIPIGLNGKSLGLKPR
jgi:ATP-binding protein involved in chromosome partitioning